MTRGSVLDELKARFREVFGLPMPRMLLSTETPVRVEVGIGVGLLVGSEVAARRPYLLQSNIGEFIRGGPPGYFLTGFWGHGVSSHAYYYSRVDAWSRVLFRLQYGGLYGDAGQDGHSIREFVIHYFDLERRLQGRAKTLLAIDSMHLGRYEVVMVDGRSCEWRHSLYRRPQFMEIFGHLVS